MEPPPLSRPPPPPLFDVQVNGFAGVDFQDPHLGLAELRRAARALQADGCPRFLLTLITDAWENLLAKLRHLRRLRDSAPELRQAIAGWHIEGPFLSGEPGFHGAHEPDLLQDPTPDHLHALREATADDRVLLTLAPERRGALSAIALAVSLGFRVSLGHTNAPLSCLREAVAAGATGFTHLGNACQQALDRHDNILWRVLEIPGLYVSVIADGHHVSPALFRLLHRLLPADRLLYTTDAMAAAGAPPGRYRLGRLELEVGADLVARQPGKSNFAGSATSPAQAVEQAARMLGVTPSAARRHLSDIPATWLDVALPGFPPAV